MCEVLLGGMQVVWTSVADAANRCDAGSEVPEMRISLPRLPSEMQWLKSLQVAVSQGHDAFHFGKAANSRACGRRDGTSSLK
jgi:hypothetical protein